MTTLSVLCSQIHLFPHRPIPHISLSTIITSRSSSSTRRTRRRRNHHDYQLQFHQQMERKRSVVECSLRDKGLSKKPLWRTAHDMSSEAIQASRALTLASSNPQNAEAKVDHVFQTKISRLLKSDLLSLLFHLQRSDSCDLTIKVSSSSSPSSIINHFHSSSIGVFVLLVLGLV